MSKQPDCMEEDVDPFWNTRPVVDELSLREPDMDLLATVRCPICHFPLIAAMGNRGPRFYCGCEDRQSN